MQALRLQRSHGLWPDLAHFAQGFMLLLALGSPGCGGHRSVLGASLDTSSWATPNSGMQKLAVAKTWLPPGCKSIDRLA